jgi:hypothetical protein
LREMKTKNILFRLVLAAGGLLVGIFIVSSISIGAGVKEIADEALNIHPGGHVEALVHLMESEDQPLSKRNRAVWALGQLGDTEALSSLRKHYTGEACDHSRFVCQDELKKAIKLCEGGWNITAWTWRRFVK